MSEKEIKENLKELNKELKALSSIGTPVRLCKDLIKKIENCERGLENLKGEKKGAKASEEAPKAPEPVEDPEPVEAPKDDIPADDGKDKDPVDEAGDDSITGEEATESE